MPPVATVDSGTRTLELRTKTGRPTNASAEFILNSISLAEDSRYVAEIDRFVSLEEAKQHEDALAQIWEPALAERQKLLDSMQLLRQKTQGKLATQAEPESAALTWKDVIREVQAASDKYKKTVFARMCEKADVFEHWLNLLPNGDYTSTISGAFVIGVQAARSVNTVQKSIYEALASIPDTLAHASTYVEIYKAHSSTALVQKTAELCKCILVTLRLIIEFFLKSSIRRGTSALFKGSSTQSELSDSILEMKTKALTLREEANVCMQQRIAEMDRKNDLRASREQYRHELAKEELMLAIDSGTEITAQKVCTYLLRQLQSNPEFNIRTGGPLHPAGPRWVLTEGEASEMSEPSTAGPTLKSLLKLLDFDMDVQQDDITYCLTLGFTQSQEFQDRASWVLSSPQLGKFLSGGPESSLLVVNGNYEPTQFISPLSHACAKISDLISVSNEVFALTYFCGRHSDEWREPRANASGIITSLTAQLLYQFKKKKNDKYKLNLSAIDEEDEAAIEDGDLSATFKAFRTVVKQLPKGTVILCLVDGLSAYENSDRRDDTVRLMQKLGQLVRKLKGVVLKVMVTYPGRVCYLDKWALELGSRKMGILEVPEDLV